MISTQPVWSALLARFAGVRPARIVWAGVTISFVGVLLLTGLGGSLDAASWAGVGLALVASILGAVYVAYGERLRASTDTTTYTIGVYASAGLMLLAACLAFRIPLAGYSLEDWGLILAITVVAQLGGHSVVNSVVHRVSATVVSTAILFEAPGAAILAAIFLGQSVGPSLVLGLLVMLAGLVLVVRGSGRPAVAADQV